MPEFSNRDPRTPGFWDQRFEGEFTPWDRGGVPEQLAAWLQTSTPGNQGTTQGSDPGLRLPRGRVRPLGRTLVSRFPTVLIPGCGSAYELQAFCESGYNATAIDFSSAAVVAAQQAVGPWRDHVVEADFFTYPSTPDLIYERAFLCAMPRDMWPRVVQRWAELLPGNGLLLGYFFFDDNPKGPPFGADRQQLSQLMSAHFELAWDEAVTDSIAVFQGKERWMAWRRKKGL